MTVKIKFVSIISDKNSPLFIKSSDTIDENKPESEIDANVLLEQEKNNLLKYNFLSHISLDYIFTQIHRLPDPASTNTLSNINYALLLVHDGIAVYGLLTSTNTKILVGMDAHENVDIDLVPTFKALQRAYISYVCNPFLSLDDKVTIQSKKFDNSVAAIVRGWNNMAR
ncbi:snare-like protein [Nadsonia fulvescens var. elongata DSM 6958]|uniref:Snare-like protein n=1 Tax=Nadsonia fulvescens var. elongata DSM 6958 TaxID=857566 RepID=A0A1E3PGM5_9ASCO|nr:snare-like protein [Nadsonia fulvescens var. elongata DSM 6958]